jgi:hypothetical protein
MPSDGTTARSRRALLAAAAGAAGVLAASAALPLSAIAADPDDVVKNIDNATTATTSITQTTDGVIALKVHNLDVGAAALLGSAGDETDMPSITSFTGVFGWSPTSGDDSFFGTGVQGWGGEFGLHGEGGLYGVVAGGGEAGVFATGGTDGVVAFGGPAGAAVVAVADTPTATALEVRGKVKFSRSGRTTIPSGKSSIKVPLAGTTSSSRIFAVLHSNRSGRYVRAVVPTTGSFTIYLNTTVTASTYVAWFVIN